MRGRAVVASVVVVLAGCGGGEKPRPVRTAPPRSARPPARPALRPPAVGSDGRCPVSRRHRIASRFGPGLGDGPIYPVGFGRGSILRIAPPRRFNSREWGGDKVLWVRAPGVRGTVVIRGLQLDGDGEVRFQSGDVPPDHLDLAERTPLSDWNGDPSYTRVREPGCYAYVVEAPEIQEVIVFRAVSLR